MAGALAGCPKKLTITKEVIVEVPKVCPTAESPKPSIQTLKTVATVSNGERTMAVMANANTAVVAGIGDLIGAEGAKVIDISPRGVTLRLADGGAVVVIKAGRDLSAKEATSGTNEKEVGSEPAIDTKSQESYARWRLSIMEGISRNFGIHIHVFWALSLAFSDHQHATVANALNNLGWSRLPGIDQAYIKRMSIKKGSILADAVAPTKRMGDMILSRIRSAHPLLSHVTVVTDEETTNGYTFSIKITAPMVSRVDLVAKGSAPSSGSASSGLSPKLLQQLTSRASGLPTSSEMPGFDKQLRELATRANLDSVEVATVGKAVEEGYVGVVSFSLKANGSTASLLTFLVSLRQQSAAGRPVIIDPLHITGKRITMVLRVPYITGRRDTRKPIPGALILPRLSNTRWAPAKSLPLDEIRDPFVRGR
jgi:hypothetical protein